MFSGPLGHRKPIKKKKFQPTFGSPSNEQEIEQISSESEQISSESDEYFNICHSMRFEGQVLDVSFVNKTVLCLNSTPTDEPGSVNESERVRFTGDQIDIFSGTYNTAKWSTLY